MALDPGPGPVQGHHLLGHRRHRPPHPALGALPVGPAHAGEPRGLAPGVGADRGQLVGGDVEAVLAGVGHQQVVPLDAGHRLGHQALEAADAVVVVDHVVARAEVGVARRRPAPRPRARPAVGPAAAGDLLLAEQGDLGGHEAVVHPGGQHDRLPAGEGFAPRQAHPVLGQHPGHPVGGGGAVHGHHHLDPAPEQAADGRRHRLGIARHRVEAGHRQRLLARPGRHRRGLEEVRLGRGPAGGTARGGRRPRGRPGPRWRPAPPPVRPPRGAVPATGRRCGPGRRGPRWCPGRPRGRRCAPAPARAATTPCPGRRCRRRSGPRWRPPRPRRGRGGPPPPAPRGRGAPPAPGRPPGLRGRSVERWSATEKARTSSTRSPQKSTRTGCLPCAGYTSMRPPAHRHLAAGLDPVGAVVAGGHQGGAHLLEAERPPRPAPPPGPPPRGSPAG